MDKTPETPRQPAVPIDQSVQMDQVYCLECGQPFKLLKRHLRTAHNLDPESYRARWDLPGDFPLSCPRYLTKSVTMKRRQRGKM